MQRFIVVASIVASAVLAPSLAGAQVLGTFRWKLDPYCNVLNLSVTQNGPVFTLNGFDEPCGGSLRLPVQGVAVPQPDGSVTLGLTVIGRPSGAMASLEAAVSLATGGGTWRDGVGTTGTLTFNPSDTSGAPRPARSSGPIAYGRVDGFPITPGIVSATPNVASVSRISTIPGLYCVSFSTPIPADRLIAASVTTVSGFDKSAVVADFQSCNPNLGKLGVSVFDPVKLVNRDGEFTFIVP